MLRDEKAEIAEGIQAVVSAAQEVRRHVALGFHPNLVRLVDVGLFWQLALKVRRLKQQSRLTFASALM